MEIYEAIRAKQEQIIEDDKSEIVISRTARTADTAGGWSNTMTTLTSQDARIYSKKAAIAVLNTNVDEGGYIQTLVNKMLMYHDADVKRKTADNVDKFTVGSKSFEVVDYVDITHEGYIVFKEVFIREL